MFEEASNRITAWLSKIKIISSEQLYLMTVLSGNPLGEGTMQVIKSEK